MKSLYKISVIIPTYNRRNSVKRILKALAEQTFSPRDYEVIVSIDGSEDGTGEIIEEFKPDYSLRSIWSPNSGRAAACNRGIREASGDVIILLDDDMEPSREFINAHYAAHIGEERLGVMGAAPVPIKDTSQPIVKYIGTKFNNHLKKISAPGYNFQIRDFYSGNFSIRRELLLEIGVFNEAFRIYGNEDVELAWRMLGAGVKLSYNSDALATQHSEKDFRGIAGDNIAKGKTAVLLASLYPDSINHLKLSEYRHPSWKWGTLRRALVSVSMIFSKTPELIILFTRLMEKLHPAYLETCYFLSLDYFFWYGVEITLNDSNIDNREKLMHNIKYSKS
ncbi:MAG: glycosyltransferase [Deltaproteobacteria bacterium]